MTPPRALTENANTLLARALALPDRADRRLIAIAGPPGAGKSSLAEAVVSALNARGVAAMVLAMDGFHLDDRILAARGLLARKGAPETFDFGGLEAALLRIRREDSVILPTFDRSREIAIAGAVELLAETRFVVVEGNYLCLDEDPWRRLAPIWDLKVFLEVPRDELERRLLARWAAHGFDAETAAEKARGNDIPNANRVVRARLPVNLTLPN